MKNLLIGILSCGLFLFFFAGKFERSLRAPTLINSSLLEIEMGLKETKQNYPGFNICK